MSKKASWIVGVVLLVIIAAAAGTYAFFSKPVAAPSTDITAVNTQLSQNNTAPVESTASGTQMVENFIIDSTRSNATFRIFEVLRGEDFTVVGTTNQIAGRISVDKADVTASTSSEILVNARTLKTDSQQRDGAIARMILKSEDSANEFIRFTPTTFTGLPQTGVEGTAYPLRISGDLTVSGTTKPVTFDAVVTYTEANILEITAKTTIQRPDFSLVVPDLPFLADVSNDVEIELSLVASPAQ